MWRVVVSWTVWDERWCKQWCEERCEEWRDTSDCAMNDFATNVAWWVLWDERWSDERCEMRGVWEAVASTTWGAAWDERRVIMSGVREAAARRWAQWAVCVAQDEERSVVWNSWVGWTAAPWAKWDEWCETWLVWESGRRDRSRELELCGGPCIRWAAVWWMVWDEGWCDERLRDEWRDTRSVGRVVWDEWCEMSAVRWVAWDDQMTIRWPSDDREMSRARTTARSGGSAYNCAYHATAPRLPSNNTAHARTLLQEALSTAPANQQSGCAEGSRRLCALRSPHHRQPRFSGAHAPSRKVCVLRLPQQTAASRPAPATQHTARLRYA